MASWKAELNGTSDGGGVYCNGTPTTACTSTDGKFKIKAPNTGSDRYTITYTNDEGKTTTKEYVANAGKCVDCNCGKIGFTATTVSKEGGNVKLGTFDVTNDYCESAYQVTASDVAGGIATGTRISGNEVWGNVPENEEGSKTIKFNLSINGNTCQKTTTQGAGCNCGNLTLSPSQESFPNTGYNGEVASYSLSNSCDYGKVRIQGDTSVFSLNTSTHKVMANVGANPSTSSSRDFTYVLTYNNNTCAGKGQTISQGASPVPCQGCGDTSLNIFKPSVDEDGYNGRVGTYSVGSGCDISKVGLDPSSSGAFSLDHGDVLISVGPTSVDRDYYIKLSYNGEGCPLCTATVSQTVTPYVPPCCNGFSVSPIGYSNCGTGGDLGNCGTLDCSGSDCCDNITDMSASIASGCDWLSGLVYTTDDEGDWHFRAICEPLTGSKERKTTCTAYFKCGTESTSVSWEVTQYPIDCD